MKTIKFDTSSFVIQLLRLGAADSRALNWSEIYAIALLCLAYFILVLWFSLFFFITTYVFFSFLLFLSFNMKISDVNENRPPDLLKDVKTLYILTRDCCSLFNHFSVIYLRFTYYVNNLLNLYCLSEKLVSKLMLRINQMVRCVCLECAQT